MICWPGRMADRSHQQALHSGLIDSTQTLAAEARAEAARLSDPALVPIVAAHLTARASDERGHAAFVLGRLGENTGDSAAARALLAAISTESRRSLLSTYLGAAGSIPALPDCAVLLSLVHHRWPQVRHSAISALGNCRDPRAEAELIAVLRTSKDDYDLVYANEALGRCGSTGAVPALAAQIHDRAEDVKTSALLALDQICDSSDLPLFLDALQDRSWTAKWCAMKGIANHGDERAIGPVCDRVRAILARQRGRSQGPQSELVLALKFLSLYSESSKAASTISWAVTTRWSFLQQVEQNWVRQHLPQLA